MNNPIPKTHILLLLLVSFFACTQKTSNQYVARVNQVPISKELLQQRLATYQYDQHLNALDNNIDVKQAVVNELIQEQLIMQLANQQHIKVTPDEIKKEARSLGMEDPNQEPETMELIEKRLLEKKLFDSITQTVTPPSTQDIANQYEQNTLLYVQSPQIHLLQIIFKQKEDLDQALTQLKQGTTFEELVEAYALKPMLAIAGDLGFVAKDMLQPDIEQKAFALDKGRVSSPIETEMGWVVLKVLDKKEEKTYTLEEVQDQIQAQLWTRKKERHYNQWLKTEIAQANIERNHEVIQQPTL